MEVQDLELLCRACMEVIANAEDPIDHTKHDLFVTVDLTKKYTVCTSLNVEPLDGFPKYLCNSCYDKLNEFYQFQGMCVKSVQRFRDLLQLRESLEEKPVFDLEVHTKEEITVAEQSLLLSECQFVEQIQMNRSERRSRKAKRKMLNECDSKTTVLPKQRPRRSITLPRSGALLPKEGKSEELMDFVSNVCDRTICSESSQEEDIETDEEFPLAKQQNKSKRYQTKCQDDTFSGRRRRISTAHLAKSSSTVYQCDVCPMRFFVEHRLIAHKRGHDGLVPYPCPRDGCDKSFNRWHCLSEHLKQHEGTNRWFKCEEDGCFKVYKHKPTLIMHLRKFHKRGPELKSHVCEICGKVFKSSAILNDHRYTHKDKSELPFACDHLGCARRFSNKEKLKVHLLRHAGIKNFVCPYCGMRKTTRNELKIHINYHTLERTWPCRFCTQVFNSAGNLKMHVRTVHERAKDYACRYCERTFAKPDTRKYHEMTHTGEKPNECPECGKRFTQPAALRTHKKIHQRHRLLAPSIEDEPEGEFRDGGGARSISATIIPSIAALCCEEVPLPTLPLPPSETGEIHRLLQATDDI